MELLGLDIPLWIPLTLILLYLFKRYSTATYNTWSKQGINGPFPIPLIGNTWIVLKTGNFANVDIRLMAKYGNKVGMYDGRQPVLCTNDPEFIRLACIKEFNAMPNRRHLDMGPLLNHLMTVLRGDHWKHVRASLTPTFTTGKLKQMKPLVDDCVLKLVKHVADKEGTEVEVKKLCGGFTADVIASTAFGIEIDSQSNPDSKIIEYASKVLGVPTKKPTFWQRIQRIVRVGFLLSLPPKITKLINRWITLFDMESLRYFESLINQILKEEKENPSAARRNFVQMCSDQIVEPHPQDPHTQYDAQGSPWTTKGLTKLDVIGSAVIFFLAGFETTSTTLHYVLFELSHNQDVQQRAYEEITKHCSSGVASYEELSKLTYLDWIIQETLRLYSPAPRLERTVEQEVTIQGITLPKGSSFAACAQAVHYNPDVWPNPKEFDPERFSPENREGRHPCAWLPFGVGNRNCVGMRLALLEMKAALTAVIWGYTVHKTSTTQERPILDYSPNFQLHPTSPIMLKFLKRE